MSTQTHLEGPGQSSRLTGPAVPSPTRFPKIREFYRLHWQAIIAFTLLAPAFLLFFIMKVIPFLSVFYLSLTNWNGLSGAPQWVGLQNFHTFFTSGGYVMNTIRAGIFGLSSLFIKLIIGFFIALLLNQRVRGSGAYRSIWYLPTLVPFAIVAQMVNVFLSPVDGLGQHVLKLLGLPSVIFQQSTSWMFFWIIVVSVWTGVGANVIIYLAGLQGIDVSLYEAARVDGANKRQLLWNVTLPGLRPITMFLLITGLIGSFDIFVPVQLISQGGPNGSTNVIFYQIYQDAFQNFNMGMASAASVIIFFITVILALYQYKVATRRIDQ